MTADAAQQPPDNIALLVDGVAAVAELLAAGATGKAAVGAERAWQRFETQLV